MGKEVDELTPDNLEDYIDLGHDANHAGNHRATIMGVRKVLPKSGRVFFLVDTLLPSGVQLRTPLWTGEPFDRFCWAVELSPEDVGSKLYGEMVIGKEVAITVERRGPKDGQPPSWCIREYAPVAA